ncbi:MAG TPA: hypothetical protein VLV78_10805 [Thermoanaerobaculia bacterium]|nr:hypothetical protein [Thermoanaerobaculia bacterium]
MMTTILFAALALFPPAASATQDSPFACNINALTPAERTRHFDEVGPRLRSLRIGVRELENGYELQFPGDPKTVAMLTEWAIQERLCCPFFDIELRLDREGGSAWMRLTGRKGTKEFIKVDFAKWIESVKR